MGYLHDTPGHRLLRFLMKRGGHATLSEIARRANDGRLYAQAKPELDGLIVLEKRTIRRRKRRFPVTRVLLTTKGWAACAMLRPAWQPRRLPTPVLKDWFAELQAEGDEWANSFDREIAMLRERLGKFERMKEAGLIWPSPLLQKRRKDTKDPGARLSVELRREAREARKPSKLDPVRAAAQVYQGRGFSQPASKSPPLSAGEAHRVAIGLEPRREPARFGGGFSEQQTPAPKHRPAPPPPPTPGQIEARRLEAERRQRDCPICQTGIDEGFLMHDPVSHKAYLNV